MRYVFKNQKFESITYVKQNETEVSLHGPCMPRAVFQYVVTDLNFKSNEYSYFECNYNTIQHFTYHYNNWEIWFLLLGSIAVKKKLCVCVCVSQTSNCNTKKSNS